MAQRRWSWARVVALAVWSCYACRGRNGGDYENTLVTDVERRTIPPAASGVSLARSEMRPCVIRTQWTFATSWNRARYGEWVKTQLAPQFTVLRDTSGELAFSRHDDGDTHSVTIEAPSRGDTLRVLVTLCVYPD